MHAMIATDRAQTIALLAERRRKELGLNREQLVRAAGLSKQTWYTFLEGRGASSNTYTKLEHGLRWEIDSIQRFLDGGPEPAPATTEAHAPRYDTVAAIQNDPTLTDEARAHFLNQYHLLQQLSAIGTEDPDVAAIWANPELTAAQKREAVEALHERREPKKPAQEDRHDLG